MGTDSTKITLLVVDDERPLLALLIRFLARHGYDVSAVATGAEAVSLILDDARRLDIVVLDLGLPDMPGEQVLHRILEVRQDTLILVSSGSPYSPEILPVSVQSRVGFLQKPYVPAALLADIQDLLARRAHQTSSE